MSDTETLAISDIPSLRSEDTITNLSLEISNILENETNKYKLANKRYHLNFMTKHKEKINKKCVCELCFGTYSYFNKSKHYKSKRHIRASDFFESKEKEQ